MTEPRDERHEGDFSEGQEIRAEHGEAKERRGGYGWGRREQDR